MTDTTTSGAKAPDRELHLGWALLLISVAQLMVVLDASIANIALPFIGADLGIDDANLTWIVTGYALAFGGLLLLGGRLGDLYGRRRVFMIGLAVFAIAPLLGGFAANAGLLPAARGLQGLGAAPRAIGERAAGRGELRDDIDLELFEPALAGIVLQHVIVMGEAADPDLISRVIDQIIVPSATR